MSDETSANQDNPRTTPSRTCNRERLPPTRASITHKITVGTNKIYLSVGHYQDGKPAELFCKTACGYQGWLDAVMTMASICLQCGTPIETVIAKWIGTRFQPDGLALGIGPGGQPAFVGSLLDAVGKWLRVTYCPPDVPEGVEVSNGTE